MALWIFDVFCTFWVFVSDSPPGAVAWLRGLSGGGGARTGRGEDYTSP